MKLLLIKPMLLVLIAFAPGVLKADCYAVLKIRATENRPAYYPADGCFVNPVEDFFSTSPERVPYKQALISICEQCNACCQARSSNCFGYITGNWLDIQSELKPINIFSLINVKGVNLAEKDEADCICLEKHNVNDEMDKAHSDLLNNLRTNQYPTFFEMLDEVVKFWNSVPSYFLK